MPANNNVSINLDLPKFQRILVEEIDTYYETHGYKGRALKNCALTALTARDVLRRMNIPADIIFVSLYVMLVKHGADLNAGQVCRVHVGDENLPPPSRDLAPFHCVVLSRLNDKHCLYDPSYLQAYHDSPAMRPYVSLDNLPPFLTCTFENSNSNRRFRQCAGSANCQRDVGSQEFYLYGHYVPHRLALQKQHLRRTPDARPERRRAIVDNIIARLSGDTERPRPLPTAA